MRKIRKLIYRLGFRPKHGSVFFSPSEHVIRTVGPAAKIGLQATPPNPSTDLEGFYRFISKQDCDDASCGYLGKHKHGFACDIDCVTCKGLTRVKEG